MNVFSNEFIELAFGRTALARELEGLRPGDSLSAAKLLTLTDGVSDDVMEELFDLLHGIIEGFDLSDFPRSMTGEAARRLREEEQLVQKGDLLSGLDKKDQKLLTLRFGLEGGKPLTPEDTGKVLGLTPE